MTSQEIQALVEQQRKFYKSGATLSLKFRKEQLKKLYSAVKTRESEINDALRSDLGKSSYEAFMCESGLALTEISYMIKHLRKLARPARVRTPLAQFCSKSYTFPSPYGNTLIMSPWNYPFLLSIEPLADAIAAGNTVILKPSAYSPETGKVIESIIKECFAPEYVATVMGGRAENSALLDAKFDMVFFTGSQSVGKEVLRRTAEHLTPCVLELGGKSPCIVEESADIELAARRVVFGKFLNCGQTCVAPDFVLCHSSVKDRFAEAVRKEIKRQFGDKPLENPNYGKIINRKHFDRLCGLVDGSKVIFGGNTDEYRLRIAPTVMVGVEFSDAVMQEEIFGPIMPIISYESFDETVDILKERDKPLALYIFSKNKEHIKRVRAEISFGGGCVNDVIIHLATSEMGFGGVGESGMGSYHGKVGFEAFSHRKSIVDKKNFIDLPMRYQPYGGKLNSKLLHFFLK